MTILFALALAATAVLIYRFFIRHSTHQPPNEHTRPWQPSYPTPQGAHEALDNQPADIIAAVASRTLNLNPHPNTRPTDGEGQRA